MKTISGGKIREKNTKPADDIIRCCGQCDFAVNNANNPNDTTNIWDCTHPRFEGPGSQQLKTNQNGSYKAKQYMIGCPIKEDMLKKLAALRKKI